MPFGSWIMAILLVSIGAICMNAKLRERLVIILSYTTLKVWYYYRIHIEKKIQNHDKSTNTTRQSISQRNTPRKKLNSSELPDKIDIRQVNPPSSISSSQVNSRIDRRSSYSNSSSSGNSISIDGEETTGIKSSKHSKKRESIFHKVTRSHRSSKNSTKSSPDILKDIEQDVYSPTARSVSNASFQSHSPTRRKKPATWYE